MTLLALLVLGLRLRQVDVDTRTRVLRMGGYRLDHLGRRGILAMDTQITDQTAAVLAVPLVQQAQIVLVGGKALVVAVVKYGQAAAEVALDAALADRGHHAAGDLCAGARDGRGEGHPFHDAQRLRRETSS